MPTVSPVLERAARAEAARRMAYDFGYPEEHEIVRTAVEHRWREYLDSARTVLATIAEPSEDILSAIKPARERDEFAKQWATAFAAILG